MLWEKQVQEIRIGVHFSFFFLIFIYLFMAVSGLKLRHAGSFVVAYSLLSSCSLRVPECVGSIVAAHGILVPQPGIEPVSPELEGGFLTTAPPGKSQQFIFQLVDVQQDI